MASASSISQSKQSVDRRTSCDTVCSSNSSCYLHKRKPTHPLATSIRMFVPKNNSVKQRVLSARRIQLRSLQSQLTDANFHLSELQQENRALKHLQTRQDKALSKYEGTNAELPKILKSHDEETRVLMAKNKALRKNLREVSDQLKVKEEELANAREQVKNLSFLVKQKNLGERQALNEQVEELKGKLTDSDEKISLLNRKIQLEAKNYKFKLNAEVVKSKQAQKDLVQAIGEIDRLSSIVEPKSRIMGPVNRLKRFSNVNHRQTLSQVSLTNEKNNKEDTASRTSLDETSEINEPKITFIYEKLTSDKEDVDEQSDESDIRLEPISTSDKDEIIASNSMTSPTENVKARLSSGNSDTNNSAKEQFNKNSVSFDKTVITISSDYSSTKQKLAKLDGFANFESALAVKPSKMPSESDTDERFGNLCTELLTTSKNFGSIADQHRNNFESAKKETVLLLESLRETDSMNSKLRHSNFLDMDNFKIPDKDVDLVNEIWNEEYNFRKDAKSNFVKSDRNGNVIKKDTDVGVEDKTKLLATLRAIDNGEELEDITYDPPISSRSNKLVDF